MHEFFFVTGSISLIKLLLPRSVQDSSFMAAWFQYASCFFVAIPCCLTNTYLRIIYL